MKAGLLGNTSCRTCGKSTNFERSSGIDDFTKVLLDRGIKRGTGSWHDYERGKKIIYALAQSSAEYDQMIAVLVDFLQV